MPDQTPPAPSDAPETLKFYLTPVDPPLGEPTPNPHAKASTFVPDVVEALQARFNEAVLDVALYANEHTVRVEAGRLPEVCRFLKDELGFDYFADLGGIDRFTDEERFEVYYNLVSLRRGRRLRLKVRAPEEHPVVPSIAGIYPAANWNEREAWDMFGIRFEGHPDHRRMYMPEDFEYHPLRKEFPLLGIPGSLPLPPQTPEGGLTLDPYPLAQGSRPVRSYDEPAAHSTEKNH